MNTLDELWKYICIEVLHIKSNHKTIYVVYTNGCENTHDISIIRDSICVYSQYKAKSIFLNKPIIILKKEDLYMILTYHKYTSVSNTDKSKMLKEFAKNYLSSIMHVRHRDILRSSLANQ